MPRTKNKIHSPYYMGAMAKYCDLAIGGHPSARPTGEEQAAWFAKHLRKKGEQGADWEVPGVESLKKVYCKMRRSPWSCSFDESTLNKVCGMIGKDVDFADFKTYEDFKKWMGEPPNGDENWLAIIARERIQQLFEETEKQKLLIRNAENTARSLTFDIEKIEQYFAVGNLSAVEANKYAKFQKKQLEQLEKLADFAIQEIATESFVKAFNTVFVYDSNKILTVTLTAKLWNFAWKIDQYLKGLVKPSPEMLRYMLDLKCNLMKTAGAMDKNEMAQQLNREFLELIEENAPRHTFDLSPLISYHLGNCIINPHFYHLNPEYCSSTDESTSQKSLSPFYYYLLGIIQYYRGRQFYTAAVQNLHHALKHWSKTELNKSVEAGHAYYLLSKIQQEMGYFVESMSLSEKASVILGNVAEMDTFIENHPVTAKKSAHNIEKEPR
jgi:hypothetical protein